MVILHNYDEWNSKIILIYTTFLLNGWWCFFAGGDHRVWLPWTSRFCACPYIVCGLDILVQEIGQPMTYMFVPVRLSCSLHFSCRYEWSEHVLFSTVQLQLEHYVLFKKNWTFEWIAKKTWHVWRELWVVRYLSYLLKYCSIPTSAIL